MMKYFWPAFGLFLLQLFSAPALAVDSFELDVPSGETLTIDEYPASSKTLLLWFPSERGFGDRLEPVFTELAQSGVNVWAVLLHDSYLLPTGKHSLEKITVTDMLPILKQAQQRGFDKVFILGANRSTGLLLQLAYQWQLQQPASALLKGLLFFSPHLTLPADKLGEDADFIDISAYSNLPVYILQTEYSTKFARIGELSRRLAVGGSPVFIHSLRGVLNGFYLRLDDEMGKQDRATLAALPGIIRQAIKLMQYTPASPLIKAKSIHDNQSVVARKQKASTDYQPGLQRYKGKLKRIALKLKNLDGKDFDLDDYRGRVVLVNFWATWCAPCIEEMPSLSRLNNRMKGKPFKLIAVNIGEIPQNIRKFLQRIPANFEILVDPASKAVRDWKVYAYPSNYIVDKQGEIHFAYRGALEWDAPEVMETIESLF